MNKKGYYGIPTIESVLFIIGFMFICFFGIYLILSHDGRITIEKNYLSELQQCEKDLENMHPICPDCKCSNNCSWIWIFAFIIGLFWGFAIKNFLDNYYKNKFQKKKKK